LIGLFGLFGLLFGHGQGVARGTEGQRGGWGGSC
jgi:hypothetical protein